jgi:hypothetical protein
MHAEVTQDTTTRVINVEVTGAPDIDVTRSYHRKPRIFRPGRASLVLGDGELRSIKISGGLVLKSDVASTEIGEKETYYPDSSWSTPKLKDAPEWVRLLVAEAPAGVTTWRTGTDAGEVQAL